MKQLLILTLSVLFLLSCAKKSDNQKPSYLNTPLHKVIDAKYIQPLDDSVLYVKYLQYDTTKDCSKEVYQAAIETVSQSTGINRIDVEGKALTMRFRRGSNVSPARNSLTRDGFLYKQVYKPWKWQGYLTIKKENSFLTEAEFEKAITVSVRAVFTDDGVRIVSKTINGDFMTVIYEVTKSSNGNALVSYEVKANTPVTFKSEWLVDCKIPVYAEQGKFVNLVPEHSPIIVKDLGNGVTSYSDSFYNDDVIRGLSYYVANQYFATVVYPKVK